MFNSYFCVAKALSTFFVRYFVTLIYITPCQVFLMQLRLINIMCFVNMLANCFISDAKDTLEIRFLIDIKEF